MKSFIFIIMLCFLMLGCQKAMCQAYFNQDFQIRVTLMQNLPAVVTLGLGWEWPAFSGNMIYSRGIGFLISGMWVSTNIEGQENSAGAFGGGVYARMRIGYQTPLGFFISTTPEVSIIHLIGKDAHWTILEMATDVGLGTVDPETKTIVACDLLRIGVRPGNSSGELFFAAFYPRFGIMSK